MRQFLNRGRGFTLVEVLIVVAIIGMLAGLGTVAYRNAIWKARKLSIDLEMDGLVKAMHFYKEKTRQYPPAFADTNLGGEGDYSVKKRFVDHLKFAFPRYAPAGDSVHEIYENIRTEVLNNYRVELKDTRNVIPLDLNNLVLNNNQNSQAEALVFWLGGFPMPVDADNIAFGPSRLAGFNASVFNPFLFNRDMPANANAADRRQAWLSKRTLPLYSFTIDRLVDQDRDGWWEYVPDTFEQLPDQERCPFVYFDAGSYARAGAGAKSEQGGTPTNNPGYRAYIRPATFGTNLLDSVVPYIRTVRSGNQIDFSTGAGVEWMADDSFQIICAGMDSRFSPLEAARVYTVLPSASATAAYMAGRYRLSDNREATGITTDELDNQVSFSSDTLRDINTK